MSEKRETGPHDWVANKSRFILTWVLPAILIVITGVMQLAPWITGSIWAIALSWMGYACLRNARQCGRMHCFFSGPFFLGSAMLVLGIGMQWMQWLTFSGLRLLLLIGAPLVCVLPEMFWGTYKTATHGKKNECDSGVRYKLYKTPLVICGVCILIVGLGFSLKTAYRDPSSTSTN